mmetsp:Transcript_33126/g.80467  ORF Transcript_33126/g.80467 Transcript_33126/m.80467 type:complete len:184 (+) Transcript_33126:3206-3757(+)
MKINSWRNHREIQVHPRQFGERVSTESRMHSPEITAEMTNITFHLEENRAPPLGKVSHPEENRVPLLRKKSHLEENGAPPLREIIAKINRTYNHEEETQVSRQKERVNLGKGIRNQGIQRVRVGTTSSSTVSLIRLLKEEMEKMKLMLILSYFNRHKPTIFSIKTNRICDMREFTFGLDFNTS